MSRDSPIYSKSIIALSQNVQATKLGQIHRNNPLCIVCLVAWDEITFAKLGQK